MQDVLQRDYISDICTRAGVQVDNWWLRGEVCTIYSQYLWLRTGTPLVSEWSMWHRAIHIALNLDKNRYLPRPLGAWWHNMDRRNQWYMTTNDQRLWHNTMEGWQYHTKIPHWSRTARFHPDAHQCNARPYLAKCNCITTISSYQHILVQSGALITNPIGEPEGVSSWEKFQLSHFACSWKLEVEEAGKALAIVKAIEDGTAIAVSNGSFKNGNWWRLGQSKAAWPTIAS